MTDLLEDVAINPQKSNQGSRSGDSARYLDLFGRLPTEQATLSPDGKHLAYTMLIGDEMYLYIVAVDWPETLKTRALIRRVQYDRTVQWNSNFNSRLVDWFHWVTPHRLVIAGLGGSREISVVTAIDADGSNHLTLREESLPEFADAKVKRAGSLRVVGFHPTRSDSVVLSADFIYQMRGQVGLRTAYSFNVLTGKVAKLSETLVPSNSVVLSDPWGRARITFTKWADAPDFAATILDLPVTNPQKTVPLGEVTEIQGFSFNLANVLGSCSVPLGFDRSGDTLYYASNVGRDTHGIYALDLKTKRHLPGTLESPSIDLLSPPMGTFTGLRVFDFESHYLSESFIDYLFGGTWRRSPQLVMDRFAGKLVGVRYAASTRTAIWYRPELQEVQDWLAAERPGISAEILEWDQSLNRFLIREQGPADPGAFFVLDRARHTYTRFVRRGPEPAAGSVARLTPFAFTLSDGSKIDGVLALPKEAKLKKTPLVLLCPDFPWQRRGASYQPEFEALTRMGLAVAIYNGRGVWGTGLRERQKLQGDYVGVQVADLVAVADHLADQFAVSRRRVALVGQGHGGYAALRALQSHPDRFRCAVTVEAWIHGNAFFDALVRAEPLRGSHREVTRPLPTPLTEEPERIKSPVFTIVDFSKGSRYHANTALHRAVKRTAPDSELLRHYDRAGKTPAGLAHQWARIESFLNFVLYDFRVDWGDLEVLPDRPEAAGKRP